MKVIYFLQNPCDFECFVDYLKDYSLQLHHPSNHMFCSSTPTHDCDKCSTYYISHTYNSDQTAGIDTESLTSTPIKFVTSYKIDSYWQLGRIVLTTPCSKTDVEVYKKIVNYIKNNYALSDDKMFYIGANMYNDWLNYDVNFLSLFSYEEMIIDSKAFDFNHFRNYILEQGYIIKGDGLDIRTPHDESIAEGYVIFSNECNLITRISARRQYYTCNSQCVFLQKNRDKYTFTIDKRLLSPPFIPIKNLCTIINTFIENA